ncbi:MAG: hypothetical protein JXB49_05490 [Bacteroidales bacterium]|nr:hypothetical protein [Bacteroidales bacterium]
MKITICSSVEFTPQIIEVKEQLESLGYEVNIPHLTEKIIKKEMTFEDYISSRQIHGGDINLRKSESIDLIKRYWDFIKNSDAILVINESKKGIQNYIGGNTLMEMGFAYGHRKKIFLFNPVPERSERMHYVDEIINMKPIIINKNLKEISRILLDTK